MSSHDSGSQGNAVSIGLVVVLVLAVATIIEYVIAIEVDKNLPVLIVIAFFKAGLILYYFMHIVRAWASEEHS